MSPPRPLEALPDETPATRDDGGSGTPTPKRSALFYLVGGAVFLATLLGVIGIGRHRIHEAMDDAQARVASVAQGPRVRFATVKQAPGVRHLVLQGEARPFFEVTLYAKVAGFLSDLKVDKGDRVKKNQLIATVTAPELDAQYNAAVADARNKRVNAKRLTALAPAGVVSAQELELGQATADVADATQSAIATERGYRVIRAPFDGVISARFADPGTLIQSAANAQNGAVPIVSVSKGDQLRVYVYVDQSSAPFVHAGDAAVVTVPERPGWSRQAKVARTSGELSPRTRTMLTEVDISNDDHLIVPGSYVQVTLDVRVPPLFEIPAEALLTRGDKSQVAVLDAGQHVHYKPVVVADDDGQVVRLVSGLAPGERVALDLGTSVQDGSPVQVVEAAKPPPASPPGR
jgi:RND family efflux transporter MFP subunit